MDQLGGVRKAPCDRAPRGGGAGSKSGCRLLDINAQTVTGETPLHLAIRHSSNKMIPLLLSVKPNPNLKSRDGMTPLHYAAL